MNAKEISIVLGCVPVHSNEWGSANVWRKNGLWVSQHPGLYTLTASEIKDVLGRSISKKTYIGSIDELREWTKQVGWSRIDCENSK